MGGWIWGGVEYVYMFLFVFCVYVCFCEFVFSSMDGWFLSKNMTFTLVYGFGYMCESFLGWMDGFVDGCMVLVIHGW